MGCLQLSLFGFLLVSKFTVLAQGQHDDTTQLSIADVNRDSPKLLQVQINQSKMDPFCQGVKNYLGKIKNICPIRGIVPYMAQHGGCPSPLYLFQDCRRLTRHLFSTAINRLLTELQIDKTLYNTHSFGKGAATLTMQVNISDVHVQMLDRW